MLKRKRLQYDQLIKEIAKYHGKLYNLKRITLTEIINMVILNKALLILSILDKSNLLNKKLKWKYRF